METFYCDNYEELTGRERDGSIRDDVQAKVIEAPAPEPVQTSDVTVETA